MVKLQNRNTHLTYMVTGARNGIMHFTHSQHEIVDYNTLETTIEHVLVNSRFKSMKQGYVEASEENFNKMNFPLFLTNTSPVNATETATNFFFEAAAMSGQFAYVIR